MSIEAMKMALEALDIIRASCSAGRMIHADNEAAIAEHILRQAIEKAEQDPIGDAQDRLIAEQAVTWDASAPLVVHPHPAFQNTPQCKPLPEDLNSEALETIEIELPDRQSVVLTDEEIWDLWVQATIPERTTREFVTAFARAIEAKIKEKNT
jgi:hypothetical protein